MKFKSRTKDCQLFVRAKASFGESIDEKEIDRFSRIYLRGFLKPRIVKKNFIEFAGPVATSLYEQLKKPISKRDFYFILEQTVAAVQKLEMHGLNAEHLFLNLHDTYINKTTKEVQFLYLPGQIKEVRLSIAEFMEAVVYSVKLLDEEQDREFVSRFIYFFRSLHPFDVNKVEAYIAKEDRSVVNVIKSQNVGQSGFMTNKRQHYYEHYGKVEEVDPDEPTGLLSGEDDETTGLLNEENEETALLMPEDDEATGLLVENQSDVRYPSLFRVLTEEMISVNKPVFRLGKEKSYVDYFVNNNIAVSRSHADIITRGNKYFVKDLNSKNRTFVNNREIPAYMEMEIQDGDRLKLGNEEFIFYA